MPRSRKREPAQAASVGANCPPGLLQALRVALGKGKISTDETYRWEVAADATRVWHIRIGLPHPPTLPWAVVRPTTTEDVAAAVKVAAKHRVPVVPYGGGSGLSGGAVSLRPGIVIDLRSMGRILDISAQDRTAWVEAGVTLQRLNDTLETQGFILGHDPWSLPVATVGGAISTNGLGYLAGRYGSMGDQVLALTVVLPDGSILRTRALPTHSAGINLNHLFIGAEGTLGIITEAVLRVFPRPERRSLYAFAFPTFEDGFRAVLDMLAIGMRPSVADYGEDIPLGPQPSHRPTTPPTLYLVLDGFREEVEAQERRALEICRRHGGRSLGPQEATRFWEHRHDSTDRFLKSRAAARPSSPAEAAPAVRFAYLNVVVPLSRVLEYRRRCQEILARYGVHLIESGFWGSPELFSLVMVKTGPDSREAQEVMAQVTEEVLALAQEMGGAMEQCHGVGLRWAHLMERQHGTGLGVMRQIKKALDPHNIMNPGKLALSGKP